MKAKKIIIIILLVISGVLFNLMDNEKITYLSIDSKLASAPNKIKRTNKNKTTKVVTKSEEQSFDINKTVNKKLNNLTNIKIENKKIIFNSTKSNLVSNINKNDLEKLINSKKDNWYVFNDEGKKYDLSIENNIINLDGEDYKSLSIFDSFKFYTIDYKDGLWELNYPKVSVGKGINVNYFSNIESALKVYKNGDVITILNDIETNTLNIDKNIIIDGNNNSISSNETLFKVKNKNINITLDNININTKNLINVKKDNKVKVNIINSKILYIREFSNKKVMVNKDNATISSYL